MQKFVLVKQEPMEVAKLLKIATVNNPSRSVIVKLISFMNSLDLKMVPMEHIVQFETNF